MQLSATLAPTLAFALTATLGAVSPVFAGAAEAGSPPQRIVAAGGDMTEIVFALGHGDRIVAVDSTSVWPPEAKALPQVGYYRRLAPEGVLSLSPDLLLAGADVGPAGAVEVLESAGVAVAVAPRAASLDEIADKIRFVGRAIGDEPGAEALAAGFSEALAAAVGATARIKTRPRVLFVLSIRGGAPIVGGDGSSADLMIRAAGGENAAAGVAGYKPMAREAVIAAAPDVIVMTEAHAAHNGGLDEVMSRPDIALTPAGESGRGAMLDAILLLGLGPRAPEGVRALAEAIHPPESLEAAGF